MVFEISGSLFLKRVCSGREPTRHGEWSDFVGERGGDCGGKRGGYDEGSLVISRSEVVAEFHTGMEVAVTIATNNIDFPSHFLGFELIFKILGLENCIKRGVIER